jgi:hypothetical protein
LITETKKRYLTNIGRIAVIQKSSTVSGSQCC